MKRKNMELTFKISGLAPEDVKEINRFLKMNESDLRITKTEISQMKEMGSQLKGMGKKLKGLLE